MKKLILVLCVVLVARSSWAVGSASFSNQVMGARAMGMGNAFAGVADDPSAVYYNPAGLTQLESPAISIGSAFEPMNSDNTTASGLSANQKHFTPVVPNLYAAIPFCDKKWSFGFGVDSPFGLETHYSQSGPLRYSATDTKAVFVNFNPELAYRVNEKVSVAGGVVYGLAPTVTMTKMINITALNGALGGLAAGPDGKSKLSGDGDGWGYNLGFMFKPVEKHSIGLSYRSKITEKITGTNEVTDISGANALFAFGGPSYTANVKTELIQPQSALLGYAFKPGKWTFAADAEWIDWGEIKQTDLTFSGSNAFANGVLAQSSPIPRDWQTNWNFGLGTNYKFNDTWEARGGFLHQNRVIPDTTWNPSIPDTEKYAYTLGGSFNRPSFSIDLGYSYFIFKERTVPNGQLDNQFGGTGDHTTYNLIANVITLAYTQRFGVSN